jgi:enoyl-CoA hydratase/carnithine racemase
MRTLDVTRGDAWFEIRLTRPELENPIDEALLAELESAAARIRDDGDRQVVLLAADGAVFSCDASSDGRASSAADVLPFRCLERLPQPVIACIEGDAVGAGLELALACDIRVAAQDATFALTQVAQGAIPSAGGTQRLARLAGRATAMQMVLLGERMTAVEAHARGVVNHAVPRHEVRALCESIAGRIAARGPLAVRYAKEAIARGLDLPLAEALRVETDLTVILQTTQDRAEGVRAFVEKRRPSFRGE